MTLSPPIFTFFYLEFTPLKGRCRGSRSSPLWSCKCLNYPYRGTPVGRHPPHQQDLQEGTCIHARAQGRSVSQGVSLVLLTASRALLWWDQSATVALMVSGGSERGGWEELRTSYTRQPICVCPQRARARAPPGLFVFYLPATISIEGGEQSCH